MNELRSVKEFDLSWGYNFKFDFLMNYYEFSPNGKKIAFLVDNKTIYTFDFEKLASSSAGGVVPQKKSIDLDAHEAKYDIEGPSKVYKFVWMDEETLFLCSCTQTYTLDLGNSEVTWAG